MKKLSHNRVNLILLILTVIWTTIILMAQAIPNLRLIFRVTDSIIETMPCEYENIDNFFKQIEIIYPIVYNLSYTLTFLLIIIFLIITLFQPQFVKLLGIVIISQNIILFSLFVWDKFLINESNNTILIGIKIYLVITILVTIGFVIISIKPKIFYLMLSIVTLLQCFNTISLVIEHISHIDNIYMIFQCFGEIFIIIPYWIVLLSTNKGDVKLCKV